MPVLSCEPGEGFLLLNLKQTVALRLPGHRVEAQPDQRQPTSADSSADSSLFAHWQTSKQLLQLAALPASSPSPLTSTLALAFLFLYFFFF